MLNRGAAVLAALCLLTLTSCTAGQPEQGPPRKLAESFSELLDQRLSLPRINDFEREVYERAKKTGRIEQADYDEAYSRFASCMSEGGKPIKLRKLKSGLYRITNAPLDPGETTEHAMTIVSACQDVTTGFIPELFQIQQVNPQLIGDGFEVTYRCLERAGLVPDGYSLDQFKKSQREAPPPGKRSTDEMPFDFESDEVQSCEVGKM